MPQSYSAEHAGRRPNLGPFLGRRSKDDGLPNGEPARTSDRAIDSRLVLIGANDRLQDLWRRNCRVWIKIYHRTALVAHVNSDGGCIVSFAKGEHSADPLVLLKGNKP